MALNSLAVYGDGRINLEYDDRNLFLGHVMTVPIDRADRPGTANIAG